MDAFSYELFIDFPLSVHLRVESVGVNIFRFVKLCLISRELYTTQNLHVVPEMLPGSWFKKYMIYPAPGRSAKYGKAEQIF